MEKELAIPKQELNDKNFLSLLSDVSMMRDITPWFKSLGVSGSTIGRVLKGGAPSSELLTTLCTTERFNLGWLRTGKGAPFAVSRMTSDAETIALLTERYANDEGGGSFFCTADNEQFIIVQWSQVQRETRGDGINYHVAEVLSGNISIKAVLAGYELGLCQMSVSLSTDEFDRLARGYMGNNELFGYEDKRKRFSGLTVRGKLICHDSAYHWFDDSVAANAARVGSAKLTDGELLQQVMGVLDQVLDERGQTLSAEKKKIFTVLMFEDAKCKGKALDKSWLRKLAGLLF